jgi:hypothetical protein
MGTRYVLQRNDVMRRLFANSAGADRSRTVYRQRMDRRPVRPLRITQVALRHGRAGDDSHHRKREVLSSLRTQPARRPGRFLHRCSSVESLPGAGRASATIAMMIRITTINPISASTPTNQAALNVVLRGSRFLCEPSQFVVAQRGDRCADLLLFYARFLKRLHCRRIRQHALDVSDVRARSCRDRLHFRLQFRERHHMLLRRSLHRYDEKRGRYHHRTTTA